MSGFGDDFDQADVDPAADFLAREQDDLAGLEDEVKPAAVAVSAPNQVNGDDPTNSISSFEMVEKFEQDEVPHLENYVLNNELFDAIPPTASSMSGVSPPVSMNQPKIEPEKIRKWREEQVKRLEEKDKEEEKKKEELRQVAKKELEDWYANHAEALAKTKAANRSAEKQFVADDDEIQPGKAWERISKLCDFNSKTKPGSRDVSRMRSIILQMKQTAA